MLRVIDLFCGAGGFSNGFEQTGEFAVVFGIDIKPSNIATFSSNHHRAQAIADDIRSVRLSQVRDLIGDSRVDVVVGGPPCQGFSSLRPFRSINENDQRNTLFEQMILYVREFKPRFVVFENVVGMTHHKSGMTIDSIKQAFSELGYAIDSGVLNAVHYGVPQRRERVVILGRLGPHSPELPKGTHRFDGRSMAGKHGKKAEPLFDHDLPPALTVSDAIKDLPPVQAGQAASEYLSGVDNEYTLGRRNGQTKLTMHEATRHTERMLSIIRQAGFNRWALPDGLTSSGFSSCYSRLRGDEPSTTITVNFVHPASNRCIHPTQDRALTPREGARLQSFDDDFVFRGSRSEIVKQIGEAVPPLLGRAVASAIIEQW